MLILDCECEASILTNGLGAIRCCWKQYEHEIQVANQMGVSPRGLSVVHMSLNCPLNDTTIRGGGGIWTICFHLQLSWLRSLGLHVEEVGWFVCCKGHWVRGIGYCERWCIKDGLKHTREDDKGDEDRKPTEAKLLPARYLIRSFMPASVSYVFQLSRIQIPYLSKSVSKSVSCLSVCTLCFFGLGKCLNFNDYSF